MRRSRKVARFNIRMATAKAAPHNYVMWTSAYREYHRTPETYRFCVGLFVLAARFGRLCP